MACRGDEAFGADLLGMIAEILGQLQKRKSKGRALDAQGIVFLGKSLNEDGGTEAVAGTMAKAATPRRKKENNDKEPLSEEEMDIFLAEAMYHADRSMDTSRELRGGRMSEASAAEAREREKTISKVLHNRERERNRARFVGLVA